MIVRILIDDYNGLHSLALNSEFHYQTDADEDGFFVCEHPFTIEGIKLLYFNEREGAEKAIRTIHSALMDEGKETP